MRAETDFKYEFTRFYSEYITMGGRIMNLSQDAIIGVAESNVKY
jgi:hypothetical protein